MLYDFFQKKKKINIITINFEFFVFRNKGKSAVKGSCCMLISRKQLKISFYLRVDDFYVNPLPAFFVVDFVSCPITA